MLSIIGVVLVAVFKGDEEVYPALLLLGLFEIAVEAGIFAAVFGG